MSLVPQVGFFELMVLAVIALVVVGPKDLPKLMRGLGRAVAQVRRLGDEFRSAFDEMAREAEVDELRREIEELKSNNPVREVSDAFKDAGEDAYKAMPQDAYKAVPQGGERASPRKSGAPRVSEPARKVEPPRDAPPANEDATERLTEHG